MAKTITKTYNELKEVKYVKKTTKIDNQDITYNELRLYVSQNEYVVLKPVYKNGKSVVKTLISLGCISQDK